MPARFTEGGLSFQYPENWQLTREEGEEGWTVTVQSPDTAFLVVCLRTDWPDEGELADTALESLREEYPSLEAQTAVDSIAGQPAIGHDIQFIAFDLTNTCWTRAFTTGQGTVLLMCQTSDLELANSEPVLRAICASLEVEE